MFPYFALSVWRQTHWGRELPPKFLCKTVAKAQNMFLHRFLASQLPSNPEPSQLWLKEVWLRMDTAPKQVGMLWSPSPTHPPPDPSPPPESLEAWQCCTQTQPEPSRAAEPGDSRKPQTATACFQKTLHFCLVGNLINYLESNISLFASEKGSASLIEPGFAT